nr:sulfopyruvate decarboxylase subunit alpha [Candidatus Njordarchaeota archaeon]
MSSEIAEKVAEQLKEAYVNFFAVYPCERVKHLYELVTKRFRCTSLSREEEGVGICAGASLAGARPAMLVQSSGIGNMINALCSLTKVYQFPLLILVSWRGIYKEKVPAQVPLGERLLAVLKALDIKYVAIMNQEDISHIGEAAKEAYESESICAVLLNPMIWEGEDSTIISRQARSKAEKSLGPIKIERSKHRRPLLTRLEVLEAAAPHLEGKLVICNLGVPCKELYSVKHQKSNFYMLGSMGLASSIGLGVSMFTSRSIVVIDGDGSLLTNLGTLSTIAVTKPRNLTILAIDNGVHGSTGNQPTATSLCVDLELTARGLGIDKTYRATSRKEISSVLRGLGDGPNFVHVLAKPGNASVPELPLTPLEMKENVMAVLRE